MKYGKIFLLYVIGCMLFANAFAGRIGGGRSFGMQRSISKARPTYNTAPRPVGQPTNTGPQRSGMGAGTAAVLGAAAGAAGGYMMGKSMAENDKNTASSTASSAGAIEPANNIPWGIIAILGALLVMGLMFFRKKSDPSLTSNTNSSNSYSSSQTKFNIPNINKNSAAAGVQPASKWSKFIPNSGASQGQAEESNKMPDGVETIYFLRQVKGMFLHIQSMNNPDNASEVAKYMTSELFNDIKAEITANASIADFSNLDCQLLECEDKEGQLIASVKFFGMVSEAPEQPAHPFSEIWNFVKSAQTNNRWLVAGIQQEALNK